MSETLFDLYDVVIIGSGPSGLTAAIYTSRASLKTLVIAGNPPGGQLMITTEVENFPGFPNGVQGPELIKYMREQAAKFGSQIIDENVTKITGSAQQTFTLNTDSGHVYSARSIIIATGASAKWLGLPNESRLCGHGVSACATCDGFFFKNQEIAVVGGGDTAMEEALFLTKFASKVYVIVRASEDAMKASKIMKQRALECPKIEFLFNTEVLDVLGEKEVTGLKLKNNQTNLEADLKVTGMFLAIGHRPNTEFIKDLIELGKGDYAVVKDDVISNVEGIFISGDVADHQYRQAITAAGFGCMAALDAEKFLAEKYPLK
ncbi:MAG TPA: thioredoxin-disulfide reductase [Candidatus Saccharimonadales bacterium]|nr:thioredoxin-disulfide reductase [Candidatus Saccharimonadales bacterium]